MQNSNIYNAIVVGDNPDDLMALYDVAKKCDKYIKYYYRDAERLQNNAIRFFNFINYSRI